MLRVNTKVLERWRGAGGGPRFVRLTRKTIRYQLSDIEAFIAARLRSSTASA
jgi:sarcosine oxidase delta subunit